MTSFEETLSNHMVAKYFSSLIGRFYKILPMKENEEATLHKYMLSLQREMIGCKSLILAINEDELYLRLLGILQYMIENDCGADVVKTEIFRAIGICKLLKEKYCAWGCAE